MQLQEEKEETLEQELEGMIDHMEDEDFGADEEVASHMHG